MRQEAHDADESGQEGRSPKKHRRLDQDAQLVRIGRCGRLCRGVVEPHLGNGKDRDRQVSDQVLISSVGVIGKTVPHWLVLCFASPSEAIGKDSRGCISILPPWDLGAEIIFRVHASRYGPSPDRRVSAP